MAYIDGKEILFSPRIGGDSGDGKSAYEIALENGFEGTEEEWLKSLKGKDGEDGTSVTVTDVNESTEDGGSNVVTFSDGKTLTVKNGNKGKDGEDGQDYVLTEADKAEIVQLVIESLGGNPVFGYVDENNNIILSGNLADGTYTAKYEMADGSTVDIGNLVLETEEDPEPVEPTNFFVVGGDGYIEKGRCSSTGEDRNTGVTTCFVTNYIDVAYGDIVYIKGYQTPTASGAYCGVKYTDNTTGGFMLETDTTTVKDFSLTDGVAQFTVNAENADYMRFTILIPSSLDDIIINIKRNGEWL